MSLFVEALSVAARCQAEVAIIAGTGIAASAWGILESSTLKSLSKFHLTFLQPALVLQLSRFYSFDKIVAWGAASLLCWVHIAIGAALGWCGATLFRFRAERRVLLVLTTAYGNCGALPFVLILPIVKNWSITRDDPESLETGLGVIGLYLAGWFTSFFTVGTALARQVTPRKPLAREDSAAETAASTAQELGVVDESLGPAAAPPPPPPPLRLWLRRATTRARSVDRVILYMLTSLGLGCIPWTRNALMSGGSLGFLGDAWASLGTAGICLSTAILGAGLWNTSKAASRRDKSASGSGGGGGGSGEGGRYVSGTVSSSSSASGATTETSVVADADAAQFVMLACLLRLVVLPCACLPLHLALRAAGALSLDPTILMVLCISAGTPSSQTLVIVLTANGATATAERASRVYVPMYALSVLSVSLLIVIVCLVVGEA